MPNLLKPFLSGSSEELAFRGEWGGSRDSTYTGRREFTRPEDVGPNWEGTLEDVAHARGGRAFGDYGRSFSRGRGEYVKESVVKRPWPFSDKRVHDIYDASKDYVISDKLEELYMVFEGRFDPDLAFRSVGGTDLYTYEIDGGMRTEEITRKGDQRTYQLLHQSEQRRRRVFTETLFQ